MDGQFRELKKIGVGLTLIVSLILSGCSSPRVSSFTNQEASFEAYSSFSISSDIENIKDISEEAKQLVQRMEELIKNEMESRDYSFKKYSDITVSYQIVVDKTVDYDVNRTWGNTRNYYRSNPYDYTYLTERIKKEGVLIIDIMETYSERLVWQGSLKLNYVRNKEHPLEESVKMIFADYPYVANNAEPVVINE